MEKENIFSELQRLTTKDTAQKKLTYDDLIKGLETVIIENPFDGFIDNPLMKTFFETNGSLIIDRIKSNKNLTSAIETLSKVYLSNDEKSGELIPNPLFYYIVVSTEHFIENLVNMFLSLEIEYLIHLKKLYKDSYIKTVRGKLLNFNLEETFTLNEKSFYNLLDNIGNIVKTYSKLLLKLNAKWREKYFEMYQENKKLIIETQGKQQLNDNRATVKSKVDEKKKILNDPRLLKQYKEQKQKEGFTVEEIAKKLGITKKTLYNKLNK